eukprot:TRINITY_DN20787_c0_g2_i1.p1 TRINITY_DN20787_c0_g2~~TRINITY_DN20787_c0_g2_i1.p1  ORF type:complete len:465 (-),score=106.49 TRINITY_DN20787_c0_g2_i1:78-1472(-)
MGTDAAAVETAGAADAGRDVKEEETGFRKVEKPAFMAPKEKWDHRRTGGEVHRCRKGHRTEIKAHEWRKFGYADKEEVITRPLEIDGVNTLALPRVNRKDITPEQFFEEYCLPCKPCIIEGAMEHWPAMQKWMRPELLKRLRHTNLKVGEDDKGRKLRMKYKYFDDYLNNQKDDSPLYLFETRVDADPVSSTLLADYEVPDLFPHDFFDLVNPDSKPPYRWWSIGPKRSGTTVHTDPLGTAAWNAVTHGRKRWVLFEPGVSGRIAKGKDVLDRKNEDDEAIMYFDFLLPRLRAKHPEVRIYLADQGPGEVIFVPGDWWHGVLNLDDAVSCTQNYCGYDNFDRVWKRTRKERKKLSHLWFRNMRKFAPELYARALELNRRDGYKMRHEKKPEDHQSSSDSSGSESSSDSTSDHEEDLDLSRVLNVNTKIEAPWKDEELPPKRSHGWDPDPKKARKRSRTEEAAGA